MTTILEQGNNSRTRMDHSCPMKQERKMKKKNQDGLNELKAKKKMKSSKQNFCCVV